MCHLSSLIFSITVSLKNTRQISVTSWLHNPNDLSGRLRLRKPRAPVSPVWRLHVPHMLPKESATGNAKANSLTLYRSATCLSLKFAAATVVTFFFNAIVTQLISWITDWWGGIPSQAKGRELCKHWLIEEYIGDFSSKLSNNKNWNQTSDTYGF